MSNIFNYLKVCIILITWGDICFLLFTYVVCLFVKWPLFHLIHSTIEHSLMCFFITILISFIITYLKNRLIKYLLKDYSFLNTLVLDTIFVYKDIFSFNIVFMFSVMLHHMNIMYEREAFASKYGANHHQWSRKLIGRINRLEPIASAMERSSSNKHIALSHVFREHISDTQR